MDRRIISWILIGVFSMAVFASDAIKNPGPVNSGSSQEFVFKPADVTGELYSPEGVYVFASESGLQILFKVESRPFDMAKNVDRESFEEMQGYLEDVRKNP